MLPGASPCGWDSPLADAGATALTSASGEENDVFMKKTTSAEDRRTKAMSGTILGSLFEASGAKDEASATEDSCDDNRGSDTPGSRVCELRNPFVMSNFVWQTSDRRASVLFTVRRAQLG